MLTSFGTPLTIIFVILYTFLESVTAPFVLL